MTPQEARALAKQRLIDNAGIPALTGQQLKRILSTVTDNDWDLLAADIKADNGSVAYSRLRGWVEGFFGDKADAEIDAWIADGCVPPTRLTDIL